MARFKQVETGALTVDHGYQRDLDDRRVRRMVKNFEPRLLGALEVSHSNGRQAVFDGQHRLAMARELGLDKLPCLVHTDLTPEQEAELFVALQRERKGIKQIDRFRAQVFAGDETACAINAIVASHGFEIGSVGKTVHTRIQAVVVLRRLYAGDVLDETLVTIQRLWYGDVESTHGAIIEGLGLTVAGYGDRFIDEAFARLRAFAPADLLRKGRGRATNGSADGVALGVAAEIQHVMGLRGRPRSTKGWSKRG